jgi:hypothetical protein
MAVRALLIFLAVLLSFSDNQPGKEANGFEKTEASTLTCEESVLTKKRHPASTRVFFPSAACFSSFGTSVLPFQKITIATHRYLRYRSLRT